MTMKPTIVDILTKILEGISKNIPIEELNKTLLKSNEYDQQTLSIAFSLIYDKIIVNTKSNNIKKSKKGSIRFLSEEEREQIGLENYNYLLYNFNLGLIDTDDLTYILDQLTMYPITRLSKKEINWMILASIVDITSDIPPGSRIHLYSSDSVN